ncbi:DUF6498-containing protein [Dokdonia sinensis]|nr:DUF6498-containing protein [Dokdonia sinensis]
MLRDLFYPNKGNLFIYINAAFLLTMMAIGVIAPITVVFGYFLETIVIGILNVVKMYIVVSYSPTHLRSTRKDKGGIAAIPFFIIHYGAFVAIQSILGFSLFEVAGDGVITDSLDILGNYQKVLQFNGMGWVLGSIIAGNLGYFLNNFLSKGKYKDYTVADLMITPYVRIFVQQFVVILSGFFMIVFSSGFAAGVLLVLFRTIIDLIIAAFKEGSTMMRNIALYVKRPEQSVEEIETVLQKISE